MFLLSFLLMIAHAEPEADSVTASAFADSAVDALVQSVITEQALMPKKWENRTQTESLDLNTLLHQKFPEGIAYGATAAKLLSTPFDKVRDVLLAPGSIYRVVTKVSSMRDFAKVSEEKDQLRMKLAIKVPVVSDFHIESQTRMFDGANGQVVMEWKQVGDSPDLTFSQGALIAMPQNDKTKIFVIGVHIMQPARKVPWVGRATAKAFAKTHYANFIPALEKNL